MRVMHFSFEVHNSSRDVNAIDHEMCISFLLWLPFFPS